MKAGTAENRNNPCRSCLYSPQLPISVAAATVIVNAENATNHGVKQNPTTRIKCAKRRDGSRNLYLRYKIFPARRFVRVLFFSLASSDSSRPDFSRFLMKAFRTSGE